jgi:hypothetical protein
LPLSIPNAIAVAVVTDISLVSLSYWLKPLSPKPQLLVNSRQDTKKVLSSSEMDASKSYLPLRNQKPKVGHQVENETHLDYKLRKRLS